MKFWIGVTDNQWFKYLSKIRPDEVNFRQPSATPPFRNVPIGMPFLFKLKRPFNHIAGGGFFVTYSTLPLCIAWEVFGVKNGCSPLEELRRAYQSSGFGRDKSVQGFGSQGLTGKPIIGWTMHRYSVIPVQKSMRPDNAQPPENLDQSP